MVTEKTCDERHDSIDIKFKAVRWNYTVGLGVLVLSVSVACGAYVKSHETSKAFGEHAAAEVERDKRIEGLLERIEKRLDDMPGGE